MDSAHYERIQTIFHNALERAEAERQLFAEAACGSDAELLAEVFSMLDGDSRRTSLLDRGLPEVAHEIMSTPLGPDPTREFGPYRPVKILGEGGMGVVWLAERKDAGNLVAIKFLPHAGLSPARRERFAREIKTLAKLKHPFIARLYDAGTLADGTPWFVMEYVEGVRLTDYCLAEDRPVEARLRLFRKVCEAVQYAHGQEIIHRDLKPSNILVEGDGTPRLLDFGVAKELQQVDEPSEQTRAGLRFLSPDYAAPEWVRDGTVGFYTDVYSLGVILYEVLAGRLPKSLAPAFRNARSNDLEVLCLKAMHQDPDQRYQSVEALLRDIDHYLNREPLDAQPDSLRYRLGKFVSRKRRLVLATSVATTLVVLLIVFFTVRLAKERNTALAEAARTQRIQRFMLDLFGDGDKLAAPSFELRVVNLLDRGVREAGILNADPETQAELYETLGRMYAMLGKKRKAEELLRLALAKTKTALGPEHPKIAHALVQLGTAIEGQSRLEGERLIREAVDVATRHLPPSDPTVIEAKAALGVVLADSGSYQKAIAVLEPLTKLPPTEQSTHILTALAKSQANTGHSETAESLDRQALALDRKLHGSSHPRVAFDLGELGTDAANLGRFTEAENLYREALAIDQAWYGKEHPDTALFANMVAMILVNEGKYEGAAPLLEQVLAIQEQTYGKVHPFVAFALDSLGTLKLKQGDLAGAEADFRRDLAICKTVFGDNYHQTATAKAKLAQVFIAERQDPRAEPLLREAEETMRPLRSDMSLAAIRALLGGVLVREHRYQEAEKCLNAAYAVLTNQPKSYALRLKETREGLVTTYEALKQPEKAAKFRVEHAANEPPGKVASKD